MAKSSPTKGMTPEQKKAYYKMLNDNFASIRIHKEDAERIRKLGETFNIKTTDLMQILLKKTMVNEFGELVLQESNIERMFLEMMKQFELIHAKLDKIYLSCNITNTHLAEQQLLDAEKRIDIAKNKNINEDDYISIIKEIDRQKINDFMNPILKEPINKKTNKK